MKLISSANNKLIKEVKKLSKNSSYRKKTNRFVVEGFREVKLCFDSDYKIAPIFPGFSGFSRTSTKLFSL